MLRLKFSPLIKRILFTILGLIILIGVLVGIKVHQISSAIQKFETMQFPATLVSTAEATSSTWYPYISNVGQMTAIQGINVSPQISGIVTQINFDSGMVIQAGQPIVVLDTNVLQAQLDNAKAALALAQITYQREAKLYAQGAAAQSDYDSAKATLDQDVAQVNQDQASLDQKIIRAPFSGVLGIRQVSLGQYLNAGDVITNLQQLTPIFVDYNVPQEDVSKLSVGQAVQVTMAGFPNAVFKGTVTAIGKQLDPNTRSISVRATLDNANTQQQLLPGMFVTVHTMLPQQNNIVTIPQTAVTYTLYGNTVFKVIPQSKEQSNQSKMKQAYSGYQVTQVDVQAGDQRGTEVQILKGLKPGDIVVTAGQMKLQEGSAVQAQSGNPE